MKFQTLIIVLLFTCLNPLIAQKENEFALKIYGKVTFDNKPLNASVVTLFQEGDEMDRVRVDASGKFQYFLELDYVYELHFTKDGYVNKIIEVDTRNTPSDQAAFGYEFGGWEVSLLKDYPELDKSVLDAPIGRIHYDDDIQSFDYDLKYIRSVMKKVDQLTEIAEELHKEEERNIKQLNISYNDHVKAADKLFAQDDFEGAIKKYEEALAIKGNETYPNERIDLARQKLAGQKVLDEEYNKILAEANSFFDEKDFMEAKSKYLQAKNLKPKEVFPESRLKEIATLQAQLADAQKAEARAESEKQKRFEEYKRSALTNIESSSFNLAKSSIEMALNLYPEDEEALDLKAEIDDNIAALEASKQAELAAKRKAEEDKRLADAQAAEQQKKAEQEQKQKIQEIEQLAQKLIDDGNLDMAKAKYAEAMAMGGNSTLYIQKIEEIESKIKSKTELEQRYQRDMNLVKILISKNDKKNAIAKLKTITFKYPDKPEPEQMLEKLQSEMLAVKVEETPLQTEPSDQKMKMEEQKRYASLVNSGDQYFKRGLYEQAIGKYRAAMSLTSNKTFLQQKIDKSQAEIDSKLALLSAPKQGNKEEEHHINIEEEPEAYTEEFLNEIAKEFPEGITEIKYKQGNKTITKRIVVAQGVGTVYRKVRHSWGGEYFFKNSDPISQFIWDKETVK